MNSGIKMAGRIIGLFILALFGGFFGIYVFKMGTASEDGWLAILGLFVLGFVIWVWILNIKNNFGGPKNRSELRSASTVLETIQEQQSRTTKSVAQVASSVCPSCKAPLEEGMYFCGKCGTRVR